MTILHLCKFYPPIEGGIEIISKFVVDSLPEDKHIVLSFNTANVTVKTGDKNVKIIRAGKFGMIASQPLSLRYLRELKRALKKHKPDVVHIHWPNPLAALYLLGQKKTFKIVVHWHSDIFGHGVLRPLTTWSIERRLLKVADEIIATSEPYLEASPALKRHRDKIKVIPCSIDEKNLDLNSLEKDEVESIRRKYGNKKIVFFIGRHVKYKGLEYLLEAEKRIKSDCVFLIAGEGQLTEALQNKYQSERIHWLGRISEIEKRLYLHAAEVFAFPSITPSEAFGVALLEAMYCGCAPVTFTIPKSGVNWVSVKNQTGLEAENSNSNQLAGALDYLIEKKELRDRLSSNAMKRVREMFTREVVSAEYRAFYKELRDELSREDSESSL